MDLSSLCLPFDWGDFTLLSSLQINKLAVHPSASFLRTPFYFLNSCLSLRYSWLDLELSKLLCTLLCEGDSDFLFLVVIKVACVAGAFALRNKGGFHLEHTQDNQIIRMMHCGRVHLMESTKTIACTINYWMALEQASGDKGTIKKTHL